MSRNLFFRSVTVFLAVSGLVTGAGCYAFRATADGSTNGNDNGGQTPPPTSDRNNVVIRFVNSTPAVVDAQFYAAGAVSGDVAGDLFVPENRITAGIGVAATGLIPPMTADSVEIPCAAELVVGTTGGEFKDPDSGTTLGQGAQRYLQEGAVFDCGATLTFTYKTESGGYTTSIEWE